jgi:hypothetical protein
LITSPIGVELRPRYKKALDNWQSRKIANEKKIVDTLRKQEADTNSKVRKETDKKKAQFRQALADNLVNRFP